MRLATVGKVYSSEAPILAHAQLGDDHLSSKHWMIALSVYTSHLHDIDLRQTEPISQLAVDTTLLRPCIDQRVEGLGKG